MIRTSTHRRRPGSRARPGRLHPGRAAGRGHRAGILVGLLLPVIAGALRTAKNAAVQAEINQLARPWRTSRRTYGDYPPSRVLLAENGFYPVTSNHARQRRHRTTSRSARSPSGR